MEKEWVVLNIDEHRMWVRLSIKQPEGEEEMLFTPKFIEDYLHENGITAGINKEALEVLASEIAYGQEIEVARGKAPINGRDGFFKYTAVTEDARSKPVINPDGSVDYHNSLKLAMIKEGELFAVYEPATNGEFGYTVFSEILPPVKGKELRPLRGTGFNYDEEKREYRASYDGRLIKNDDRIDVEKIFVVKGDLNIEMGNIKFNGDVEVKGDVRSGLTIEAAGDVFIHGHVGACIIKSGKNITIKKGIQGRNKCRIFAAQNVMCSFVERCSIAAGGNVYADSILDSNVMAYNQVIVSSKKGVVVGGTISGMQGITVKEAGNDTGITTEFLIGVFKEKLERFAEVAAEIRKVEGEIKILEKHLKNYEALEGEKRTKETEATRMKILRAKVLKNTEHKKLQDEYNTLDESIVRAREESTLVVSGIAYAGIKITVGHDSVIQQKTWKNIKYKFVNYRIRMYSEDEEVNV